MDLRIQNQTVQNQTAEKLREAIFKGVFTPGEKLVEARLCEQIGVSRSSLREALRQLASEKLIVIIPNRGPFVAEIRLDEAQQIYRVRALLEGEACALYAKLADAPGLKAMREALTGFQRAAVKGDALERLETTRRFYDVILTGCGNQVIADLLQGLLARISFLRARSMVQPGRARHSAVELSQILAAIEARDARAARAAAVVHVTKACEAACNAIEAIEA